MTVFPTSLDHQGKSHNHSQLFGIYFLILACMSVPESDLNSCSDLDTAIEIPLHLHALSFELFVVEFWGVFVLVMT